MSLHLISHILCPYVQRAVISLTEKDVPFKRTYIDLANKPEWFLAISPVGKTPVLIVGDQPIFESAAILEYLEESQPTPLHPADSVARAQHRGWIEFSSSVLSDIASFYATKEASIFGDTVSSLRSKFARLEEKLGDPPYFEGDKFTLVDTAFGPVFRYFDTFDKVGDFGILSDKPKVESWRTALALRPSVRRAVGPEYPDLLWSFLLDRNSHLTSIMQGK